MIRYLVDLALNNRILVLSLAVVLFIWGIISFHNLPIEAYPDVADTYVQIVTQWPGHVAEELEPGLGPQVANPGVLVDVGAGVFEAVEALVEEH